jgi:L-ascorbate metabolism protein UlaG (beta-lactamase superfamily)
MKIKWLGHASFLITTSNGIRIITDPFGDYQGLSYRPIEEEADIVVVSHEHGDHIGGKVKGNPQKVKGAGTREVKGIAFKGIETFHDTSKGRERGPNTIFCFAVDGMTVCHMGDLGHPLSDSEIADIGVVDVILIPVGGFFTIDADMATDIYQRLKPKMVIPMHYRNDRCAFPISGVDAFIKNKAGIKKLDSSVVEFTSGQLPQSTEIIVLQHAL